MLLTVPHPTRATLLIALAIGLGIAVHECSSWRHRDSGGRAGKATIEAKLAK